MELKLSKDRFGRNVFDTTPHEIEEHGEVKAPIELVIKDSVSAAYPQKSVFDRHLEEVINPAWNFAGRCSSVQLEQMNALMGLAAEAGETLDIAKKQFFHIEKPEEFFRDKYISELGDVFYYWVKVVDLLGLTPEEVIAYNRKKIESRHPELGKVDERYGKEAIRG